METTQKESEHGTPAEAGIDPKAGAKETAQSSTLDDQLSFLNSLPEIKKSAPKPNQSVFDEHLAFLSSLRRIDAQEEPAKPAPQPGSDEIVKPAPVKSVSSSDEDATPNPVVQEKQTPEPAKQQPKKKKVRTAQKNKSISQIQREEKNRLEKEKAEAKKAEIRKRQQEAEQEKGAKSQDHRAKPKDKPTKKSLLGRFLKG